MNRNSLKKHLVEGPGHILQTTLEGHVTTLRDFGGVLRRPLDIFFFFWGGGASHNLMVTALGLCVKCLLYTHKTRGPNSVAHLNWTLYI